jgi:hypothetical protein
MRKQNELIALNREMDLMLTNKAKTKLIGDIFLATQQRFFKLS